MKKIKIDKLEIFTTIILIINILIYEIGFCNIENIKNGTYTYSLFRIIVYCIIFVIYILSIKKFSIEAKSTIKQKKKIIIAYLIISILYLIYTFIVNNNEYKIIITILAELNGLLFILYVTKDYMKNIILMTVTFGFIISISTNIYHVIDEKKHFMSAFNVAIGNFNLSHGYENEELDSIDFNTPTGTFAKKYFNEYSSFKISEMGENKSIYSSPAEYLPILYLPSSIGINMARLLGGSIADIFFAGRIANLMLYALLLIVIFELLPFKKDIFYLIYLLPMTLALSGTYSIDGTTIGFVGIFIAYVLKLYKEKKEIDVKNLLFLICLFLLSLIGKSGAYVGIGLLVFMLPIFKSIKTNKKVRYIVISIIVLTALFVISQTSKMIAPNEGDIRGGNTSPVRQIENIKNNPIKLVEIYIDLAKSSLLDFRFYGSLNSFTFFNEGTEYGTFLLFILIFYVALTDKTMEFRKKDKILMILSNLITIVIISFIMYVSYTEVGNSRILGFQARYIIPTLPLILMCISSKKVITEEKDEIYNKKILIMGLITFLDILPMVL